MMLYANPSCVALDFYLRLMQTVFPSHPTIVIRCTFESDKRLSLRLPLRTGLK
jgi:hypothetical protein